VRRGAEKVNLQVKLGNYADLASRTGPGEERLESAWDLRSGRLVSNAPVALRPELPAEDGQGAPNFLEAQKLARYRAQLPQAPVPRIVAGGEARGGVLDYDELLLMARGNPLNPDAPVNRMIAQQRLVQQQFIFSSGSLMQTTQQELSALENRKIALQRQLDGLTTPSTLRPDVIAQQEKSIQAYRAQIARLNLQIQGIRVQAAEDDKAAAASPEVPGPVTDK
jgi:hypothetical protein